MFLLESSNIKGWKYFLKGFKFLTLIELIIQAYSLKWISIAFLILYIYYGKLLKVVKKIEKIQNRFEFMDIFVENEGIKSETEYVTLIDKNKEGRSSLIIKDNMDANFKKLYRSQEKRLKFKANVVLKKDEINELLVKEGLDEI